MVKTETGTVIDVRPLLAEPAHVEVLQGDDLQARYDQLLALVIRVGEWLTSPNAQLLPREVWEEHFRRHQENQEKLRRLGDELRPVSLRSRAELLAGDALTGEIAELFAA